MKTLPFIIFLLFTPLVSVASEAAAYLTVPAGSDGIDLGPYIFVYQDPDEKVAVDTVAADFFQNNFVRPRFNVPNWGLNQVGAWARLSLYNSTDHWQRVLIEHRYAATDILSFYYPGPDGKYLAKKQGDHVNFSTRDVRYRYPVFEVNLPPGRSTYYFHIKSQGATVLPLFLWSMENFTTHSHIQYSILGIIFGIMVAMACYNLFLLLSLRNASYFFYVLYIMSCIFYFLSFQGIGQQVFESHRDFSFFSNHGFVISVNSVVIFASLFAIDFLNMRTRLIPLCRLLYVLIATSLTALGFVLLGHYEIAAKISNLVSFLSASLLLGAGILSSLRGYRPAYFYTLSWIIWLSSAVLFSTATANLFAYKVISFDLMFIGQAIEAILLSIALGDKVNYLRKKWEGDIVKLNEELNRHVEEVELIVEERTKTIRTITDHIKPGFFMIDANLKILPGFTQSCRRLIGYEIRDGLLFTNLFEFDEKTREHIEVSAGQVFADTLPEEITLQQLQGRFKSKQGLLHIEGSVIRDENHAISAILFSITDARPLYEKELEAENNQMFLWIIRHQLAFSRFIANSLERVGSLKGQSPFYDMSQVRAALHTLKGNSASFFMKELVSMIHEIENRVIITGDDLGRIEQYIHKFLHDNRDILGDSFTDKRQHIYKISKSSLDGFWQRFDSEDSLKGLRELVIQWFNELQLREISEFMGPVRGELMALSKRKGKNIKLIQENTHLRVHPKLAEFILEQLPHILRNAVDHGIETCQQREARHKETVGEIHLKFAREGDRLHIEVSDDGGGIDVEKLVAKAEEKKLIDPDLLSSLSDQEKLELVFLDQLTSLDEATTVSGRGVGLSSIKKSVEGMNGTITVASSKDEGTTFTISLPNAA
jgi:HPt (histidine-containing phosphotransfer) domain-containing protein